MRMLASFALTAFAAMPAPAQEGEKRYLYVASPGVRNYVEWGGKGILVYDIDAGHRFVRRIPSPFDDLGGEVENVKGIAACAAMKRLYVSTIRRLACIDLLTEKALWVKPYEGGCDRMAIAPDGKTLYVPSLEKDHWHVVDGASGDVLARLDPKSAAHNTVYGSDGKSCYLAGLSSPLLSVADTSTHKVVKTVGPFSTGIRPFTVDAAQSRCYVTVNDLVGFEIGDIRTGKKLHRVEVPGYSFDMANVKRHACPSHGVGLTPDEKEVWVVDACNQALHVFDNTVMPPKCAATVKLEVDQPGWITFTIRGDFAYPSTGEVIDAKSRKIVAWLKDENGKQVQSEKVLEIDWSALVPVRNGDQFGVGRK